MKDPAADKPVFQRLCRAAELPPGGRGFSMATGAGPLELFIIARDGEYLVYRNTCPHTGVNLEWRPDQFLDSSGNYIQCSTHGALFRIQDGFCVHGPCAGASLSPLQMRMEAGWLLVAVPE